MSRTLDTLRAAVGAPRTARRALLVMFLGLVVPAVIAMGILAAVLFAETQRTYENQLVATTRALSLALDRHMLQGEAVLQTLAASPALAEGQLQSFMEQASASVDGGAAWVSLRDGQGQVYNSRRPDVPPGTRLPARPWPDDLTHEPRLSDLFNGPVSRQQVIAIDRLVQVGGETMVLSYMQSPEALEILFADQQLEASWTGSIIDRNQALVARSREADAFRGRKPTPDFLRAMQGQREGVARTRTLDGTRTLSAFSRSSTTGWTFVVGVPRSEVYATALHGAAGLSLVALALAVGGAVLAWGTSRALGSDARALSRAAAAVSRGDVAQEERLRFSEFEAVHAALRSASATLLARQAAIDRHDQEQVLLINELNHRAKNSLATVQSLAIHTFQGSSEPRVGDFIERILALSRANDLLTQRTWDASPIKAVAQAALEPYLNRITLAGPDANLPPGAALALTLILHELATNAAKYGALSVAAGAVRLEWEVRDDSLALTWRETGGPKAEPPRRKGFGSRLIDHSARTALHGRAQVRYLDSGFECDIEIGAGALARGGAGEAAGR